MANEKRSVVPPEGIHFDLKPGNRLTKVHLESTPDGITLAAVGAASGLKPGNRQRLSIERSKDGIVLSMVGAASARAK